jgi:hypothetical protein
MGGVNSTGGEWMGGGGSAGRVQVSVAMQAETALRPGWRSFAVCAENELTHPRARPAPRAGSG